MAQHETTPTPELIAQAATQEAVHCLNYGCGRIRHCLDQLSDEQVWWRPHEEMNAIGNLLLHLAGNLGQWIVAGIGDTADTRDRPAEFAERRQVSQHELWQRLTAVVETACATLQSATAADLLANKRIQGHDVTKMHAMLHSVTHFQGHVQEIIGLTRQQLGDNYKFIWRPQTPEEGA